jgi:thiol-disulfide isomerase/thioredoxin
LGTNQLRAISGGKASVVAGNVNLGNYGPAPELVGVTNWLNSAPLKISDLRGKVVLVDFWTYTCINCIRTLPYITSWYEKYHDQGLVVIGVHTPEFEFEKNTQNVASALKQFEITYPVAQDNNYKTWDAYSNQYWPADYLIDANGNIREVNFGEGNYGETEKAIQTLLAEAGNKVTTSLVDLSDQTPGGQITPETYLGSSRMERFASGERVTSGERNYTLPDNLSVDDFAYQGIWDVQNEYARAKTGSELFFNFNASKVYLVMQPGSAGEKVKVYLDEQSVEEITVDLDRLYRLIDLKEKGRHLLRLEFSGKTRVYAFTFG